MAKKKENKKSAAASGKKAKSSSSKPVKKANKPAPKAAKPAAKKIASKPIKKNNKPVSKPSTIKGKKAAKPAKPVKKAATKELKKMTKAVAKTKVKTVTKEIKKVAKPAAKVPAKLTKKPVAKPIEAIAKKGKPVKGAKVASQKKGKKGDDDEDDIPAEEEDDSDVVVKDDYEKHDDDDVVIDGALDEAGLIDLEGVSAPEIDEDDDEIPEKRGRGRRKKNEGKSSGGSMEAYIRNRPLQIDINKPLIKKGNTPAPKPFLNTEDKRSRYSDKELAEFKELILEKLKEAQMDYDLLKQTLSNEDNHGTDDTSPSFKLLEDGSDVMSKEETAQLASRQEKYIVNLKNALVRIENKAYGICRVTGKLIPKERLRSVPHATLGIDAKLGQS
jgi:RNA polymerase-binding transcription factor DksA